jgi:hypothetical protein
MQDLIKNPEWQKWYVGMYPLASETGEAVSAVFPRPDWEVKKQESSSVDSHFTGADYWSSLEYLQQRVADLELLLYYDRCYGRCSCDYAQWW